MSVFSSILNYKTTSKLQQPERADMEKKSSHPTVPLKEQELRTTLFLFLLFLLKMPLFTTLSDKIIANEEKSLKCLSKWMKAWRVRKIIH